MGTTPKKTLIQRIGAAAMALLGLGTTPFWWDKVFPPDKVVAIHFQRAGASSDCVRLPPGARLHATASGFLPNFDFVLPSTGCDISRSVSNWRSGTFTLTLSDAGSISLDDLSTKYTFDFKKDEKPQVAFVSEAGAGLAQVQILMLNYANCTEDKGASLDAFAGALRFRLHNLQQAIVDANASKNDSESGAAEKALAGQYEYLRSADVLRTTDDPGSLSSIERRWSEAKALQVLSGQCSTVKDNLKLRSEVFGGRFFPHRPNSTVEIDSEVRAGELGDLRDLHLSSILYALAIEAKLRGRKDDLERPLLAAALKTVNTSGVSTSEPQRVSLCKDILASFKEDFAQDSPAESCQ